MGIARNLEKRLERLADGLSATLFRGRMHPVDLANRLVRQADLMVIETTTGPSIPNFFSVAVNPDDMASDVDSNRIEEELSHTLDATATDRGWRTGGPVSVRITADKSVGRGSIRCDATPIPAALPVWGELAEHRFLQTAAAWKERRQTMAASVSRDASVLISFIHPNA